MASCSLGKKPGNVSIDAPEDVVGLSPRVLRLRGEAEDFDVFNVADAFDVLDMFDWVWGTITTVGGGGAREETVSMGLVRWGSLCCS